MQLNSVDLPEPFGPITPRISPSRTSNDTPRTAWMPPKDFSMSRTSSSARHDAAPLAGEQARRPSADDAAAGQTAIITITSTAKISR